MPINIIFSGIGAIGGYYGAQVVKATEELNSINVHFFMRNNEHGNTVKNKGIHVVSPSLDFYAIPKSVCFDEKDLPKANILVLGTKSYDIENNIEQLSSSITEETIIITTQNGLIIPEEIKKKYPNNLVVASACHITGRRSQAGLITIRSDNNLFKFGPYLSELETISPSQQHILEIFYLLLKTSGVHCKLYPESHQFLREKFIMLSPSAAATAYFDKPIGEVIQHHSKDLKALVTELNSLYKAMGTSDNRTIEDVFNVIDKMPKEATTSMHSDISNGNTSELELLVGYVVRKGEEFGVAIPTYQKFYDSLLKRINTKSVK